jgi:hypothetical protein
MILRVQTTWLGVAAVRVFVELHRPFDVAAQAAPAFVKTSSLTLMLLAVGLVLGQTVGSAFVQVSLWLRLAGGYALGRLKPLHLLPRLSIGVGRHLLLLLVKAVERLLPLELLVARLPLSFCVVGYRPLLYLGIGRRC